MHHRLDRTVTLVIALALGACSAEDAADPVSTSRDAQALTVCRYEDFSVEITQGPSSGTKLAGALIAIEDADTGDLRGVLDNDTTPIRWTGYYRKDARVALNFEVGDELVVGTGPLSGRICDDTDAIEGIAVGPKVATNYTAEGTDLGHWILSTPEPAAVIARAGSGGQAMTNLTYGGGVVLRRDCTNCGGSISNGVCNPPAQDNVGTREQFGMCIGGLVRDPGGVVSALIQFFDL